MKLLRKSWALRLLSLLAVDACAGPTAPGNDVTPVDLPVSELSLAFGDAPVEGELRIESVDPSTTWEFSLDLDGDERFEVSGLLEEKIVVPYRFSTPGVHAISLQFRLGQRLERVQRAVVVNDPEAISVLAKSTVDSAPFLTLGGIAAGVKEVYVARAPSQTRQAIYRLRAENLEVKETILLHALGFSFGNLAGFALSGDGDNLFVVGENGFLGVLSLPLLDVTRKIPVPIASGELFFVETAPQGVYVGAGGLALVRPSAGEVLAARTLVGGWDFAVGPDHSSLAVANLSESSVRLLDARSLGNIWQVGFTTLPYLVAFSPDGERVYVILLKIQPEIREMILAVLDTDTGAILSSSIVLRTTSAIGPEQVAANPVAISNDGRYIAVPTFLGAFIIDTGMDLVRFRTSADVGCCNVSAAPVGHVFYFSGNADGRTVTKVEINP